MNTLKHFAAVLLSLSLSIPGFADTTQPREKRVPDQSIELNIQRELRSAFRLHPPDIETRVVSGEVTLRGTVPSYMERTRIERKIGQIEGVRRVTNWLRVERLPMERRLRDRAAFSEGATTLVGISNSPTKTIRGTIQVKADETLVVRDFRRGPIEATVPASAKVTLDGKRVDDDVLGEGLLVFIEAKQQNGELIAQSVEAYSPK